MYRIVLPIILFISSLAGADEFRTWSNPDKTKSFEAQFLSSKDDTVVLRLKSFKNITVDINKLHVDDQLWIKQNKSDTAKATATSNNKIKEINENVVFDTLVFGDKRAEVTKKLFESKLVSTKMSQVHIGRTGLNNIFTTREKIAGLTFSLSFNWDASDELVEVSLQSENISSQDYSTHVKNCYKELEKILISIYGKPKQSTEMPSINELKDDQMLSSHVWRLNQGGSILLGTSKMEGNYQAVVRFTKEVH
ncbi:MAG: SHD1 domain-containing protein [Akkermansiaceae bacterium]|jgi:hypothetical protein